MRITTKGRYALRAILSLARLSQDEPISIRELANEEQISPEFLEQIFFKLKKSGMILSTRGPGGGFRLSKPLNEITLHDILEAAGEGTEFIPCLKKDRASGKCPRMSICKAHIVWTDAMDTIKKYLGSITLEQMLNGKKQFPTSIRS